MKKGKTYGGLTTLMIEEFLRRCNEKCREVWGKDAEAYLTYCVNWSEYNFQVWPEGNNGRKERCWCETGISTLYECEGWLIRWIIEDKNRKVKITDNREQHDFIA